MSPARPRSRPSRSCTTTTAGPYGDQSDGLCVCRRDIFLHSAHGRGHEKAASERRAGFAFGREGRKERRRGDRVDQTRVGTCHRAHRITTRRRARVVSSSRHRPSFVSSRQASSTFPFPATAPTRPQGRLVVSTPDSCTVTIFRSASRASARSSNQCFLFPTTM